MKIQNLCASTLVAMIGITVLGGATPTFAAPNELTSPGKVSITEGTAGGNPNQTIDPEDPTQILPTPDEGTPQENVNGDKGSLIIEKTTELDFGEIQTAANNVKSAAKSMSFSSEGNTKKRGAYVQWADVRSGGTYGYTITAQLSSQFKSGANTLKGSTIDFTNGVVTTSNEDKTIIPSSTSAFQLTEVENDAKTVVTASKDAKQGKGRFIMEFGQSNGQQDTTANSVFLTVPANTASNMAMGDYTATVTWKIAAAE